ncbi:MAG: hypothetical protein ACYC0H_19920 [Solirubrobacteraceae bacterium]
MAVRFPVNWLLFVAIAVYSVDEMNVSIGVSIVSAFAAPPTA